ncbi:MAG: isoprenylcysteine carboxylmethyltransferase family protein [Rhizobiales bacterium]|nr:isoprenylcysteine carboxylmethyltransferase family protein [Hyphomicrobiales bacterium]
MNIGSVQKARKFVFFLAIMVGVALAAVTASITPSGGKMHELIEWVGIVFIVICIMGRTWSSLYISGRKNTELVTIGPYSITRNPLYFFSSLGAAGMGAQMGTIVMALIFGAIAWIVFYFVVLQEERLLSHTHGKSYRDYMTKVPRFLPRLSLWRDNSTLMIRPPGVLMTFADALMFLIAVPVAELLETLQETGVVPILMVLP